MEHPIGMSIRDDVVDRITLTIDETATLPGIWRDSAYGAARQGKLPSQPVGRRVTVPVPDLIVRPSPSPRP